MATVLGGSHVRDTDCLRIIRSTNPYSRHRFRHWLLRFREPLMNTFIKQPSCTQCGAYQAVDAGFYVEYQADPWPVISSPSDCFWMVPGTVNFGGH